MEVRIAVVEGDRYELESLAYWLRQERELAERVQLGPLDKEILVTTVSSGDVITDALVASLKGYLTPLRRGYARIRIKGGRAVEIEVGHHDEARVEALIRQALASGDR